MFCNSAGRCDIAFTVNIMIDFVCKFSDKARESVGYLYTCTYLTL